jgi:HK97 family phage major capsid protein
LLKLAELRKAAADIRDELRALLETAAGEDRDLSDEENKVYEDKRAKLDAVLTSIDRVEELDRQSRSIDKADKPVTPAPDPDSVTRDKKPPQVRAYNPELRAYEVRDRAEDEPYLHFGEFLQDVRRASQPGAELPTRLHKMHEVRAASGMSEAVPSDGGFLVQQDFASEIFRRVNEMGQVISRVRTIPISANSNGLKMPTVAETSRVDGSRWGGIRGYWAAEAATVTATKPDFGLLELNLNKLFGIFYSTDELEQDAAALGSVAMEGFVEELTFKAEDSIINGDGAGKPQGILNAGALVTVAKETGQLAKTIVVENLVKMWARCYSRSRRTAVWFINQDIEPQLYTMGITVGTGGAPVYLPAGGLAGSPYGTLFGRPVVPIEYCATLGTAGDVILADLGQYLMIEKGGMRQASSMHVRFLYDEMTYRITWRLDGQSAWSSALTPYKGTNTQSPFVTLIARA